MFEALSDRLGTVFDRLKGRGALSEADITAAMREVRVALLEADVALPVAKKLIEKYNDLAREALANGDKILSENYFQHADHFTRILNEKEIQKKIFNNKSSTDLNNSTDSLENKSSTEKGVSNLDGTQSEPN